MPLTPQQITTLHNELVGTTPDPYALGYAPFVAVRDLDNLITLLQFVRDGVTACPANGIVGGPSGTITGATNATPIVITSNGHGLVTGDGVVISGVLGNTAANGTFAVTKVNNNTFSLNGSAGSGAYTSGGTWHWCVAGIRQQFVSTQDIIGAINPPDMITAGVATALTADQFGRLIMFQSLCNDGSIALTNPDGTDNNNIKHLRRVVNSATGSLSALNALETRTGSRIEMLLGLSGVVLTEADITAALG